MVVTSILLSLAAGAAPSVPCPAAAASLGNPRLPLGRLRDLAPGTLCPPPVPPSLYPTAAAPAPEPVTVIVLHEIRVRPSQLIFEPPEVHFVDAPVSPAPEPAPTPPPRP